MVRGVIQTSSPIDIVKTTQFPVCPMFVLAFGLVISISNHALLAQGPGKGHGGGGMGMGAAERNAIHALFDHSASIEREVEWIEGGYAARTESKDPEVAKLLQRHVSQMYERLASGRMVRGWDPAFRAFVGSYTELETKIEDTDHGVKVTVTAEKEEAVLAARRHALVVSLFVVKGWEEAHVRHPADMEIVDPDRILTAQIERALEERRPEEAAHVCERCEEGACEKCASEGPGKDAVPTTGEIE